MAVENKYEVLIKAKLVTADIQAADGIRDLEQ